LILVRSPRCVIPRTVKTEGPVQLDSWGIRRGWSVIGRFGARWVARTAIPMVRVRTIPTVMKMRAAVSAFDVTAWSVINEAAARRRVDAEPPSSQNVHRVAPPGSLVATA
jgi:hypothetical protein